MRAGCSIGQTRCMAVISAVMNAMLYSSFKTAMKLLCHSHRYIVGRMLRDQHSQHLGMVDRMREGLCVVSNTGCEFRDKKLFLWTNIRSNRDVLIGRPAVHGAKSGTISVVDLADAGPSSFLICATQRR